MPKEGSEPGNTWPTSQSWGFRTNLVQTLNPQTLNQDWSCFRKSLREGNLVSVESLYVFILISEHISQLCPNLPWSPSEAPSGHLEPPHVPKPWTFTKIREYGSGSWQPGPEKVPEHWLQSNLRIHVKAPCSLSLDLVPRSVGSFILPWHLPADNPSKGGGKCTLFCWGSSVRWQKTGDASNSEILLHSPEFWKGFPLNLWVSCAYYVGYVFGSMWFFFLGTYIGLLEETGQT